MALPSDFFRPLLDAGYFRQLPVGCNEEDLKQRVVENLRINFLHVVHDTRDKFPEFPQELNPSHDYIQRADAIVHDIHCDYMDSLSNNRLFDFYLDGSDEIVVEKFRNAEAVSFFKETLVPYLADLLERNVLDEEKLRSRYCEFLTSHDSPECRDADDFWDSPALRLYASHMLFQDEAHSLTHPDSADMASSPEQNHAQNSPRSSQSFGM
ncbi:hypothetical protein ZA91_000873 [Salmonella enterica subsp. enterica]|nr:hypothetical protein [Salmonella enterica subsp. enterica serovar Mikawasima]